MSENVKPSTNGIKDFLGKTTAGLPNWSWILVVGAGVALAIIVPKYLKGNNTSSTDTSGTSSGKGLGLALDPTTGLPYAVEGLVPSGSNNSNAPTQTTNTNNSTQTTTYMIRQKTDDPFDQSHSGANIFDKPFQGNKVTGYAPWGSAIAITGKVSDNEGNTFYQLSNGGYILTQDIVSGTTGMGSVGPAWPYAKNTRPYHRSRIA